MDDDTQALATVEQLQARLPFTMDAGEQAEASGALDDLSDEARYYGRSSWINPGEAPQSVIRLVLRAAVRHMKNPEGFLLSRAGDETVQWGDRGEDSGSATFTAEEQARLREYGGGSSHPTLVTVNQFVGTRHPRRRHPGLVPAEGGGMVHYFTCDEDPW